MITIPGLVLLGILLLILIVLWDYHDKDGGRA